MKLSGTVISCFVLFFVCTMFIHPVQAMSSPDYSLNFSSSGETENKTYSLKVALYPFLTDVNHDDNAYLLSILKQQFQVENPSINLTLMISQKYDCYNLTILSNIFSEDGPHLVEADLSLLGYLVNNGYVEPFENPSLEKNIKHQAIPAGRYMNRTYAIPTWVCSQYLFSRDPAVMDIHNIRDLSTVFQAHSSQYPLMLVSDFQGGGIWMLPMLYVFAFTDDFGYSRKMEAIYGPVNRSGITTMTENMDWCSVDGVNNCLNGYYSNHSPSIVFAKNRAFSYNGYSENLYNIRRTDPSSILYIISTPYGNEQNTLIWVDGLVINRKACDNQCMEAASQFVTYYNSLRVKNLITFSEDAIVPAPPRYILPSTNDFYLTEKVRTDRYYKEFEKAVNSAESFPNSGITDNISERYTEICDMTREKIPDIRCICGVEFSGNHEKMIINHFSQ